MAFWMSTSVRVSTDARGLVEDEDGRVGQEGAGDGKELPLAGAMTALASSSITVS